MYDRVMAKSIIEAPTRAIGIDRPVGEAGGLRLLWRIGRDFISFSGVAPKRTVGKKKTSQSQSGGCQERASQVLAPLMANDPLTSPQKWLAPPSSIKSKILVQASQPNTSRIIRTEYSVILVEIFYWVFPLAQALEETIILLP